MQRKILTFIARNGKLLALYGRPHPLHGKGGWFVVTGGVEENETHKEAVTREVMEETGLISKEIMSLNWGSIYNWMGDVYEEHNFISFVDSVDVTLSEEHSQYEWLDIGDFIEKIKWDDDKKLLRRVLEKALNKEKYFEEFEIKDYHEDKENH